MAIKQLVRYETLDGKLFARIELAKEHENDLIGEALDDLLPYDDRGNVTQSDRHNMLIKQLNDPKLKSKIETLYRLLQDDQINIDEE